jgi:hypothetical protein
MLHEHEIIDQNPRSANTSVECPPILLNRLKERLGYGEDSARAAWTEFLRFLVACGDANKTLAPSRMVDEIWHEAILDTRNYASTCQKLCGRFIHHVPITRADHAAYARTLTVLRKTFGSLDSRFWPSSSNFVDSDLGDCSSDGGSCGSACSN